MSLSQKADDRKSIGMDWQFKPPAKTSFLSERPFSEGDQIVCFIYVDEENTIQRADVHLDESSDFVAAGGIMGRWAREVKSSKDEEREARKQALATTEELFLSLFAEDTVESESKDVLKQLLALMLERKRILKPKGKAHDHIQKYVYTRTKEEFEVPVAELSPEQILGVETQLQSLIA